MRDVLPSLVNQIIELLASSGPDQQEVRTNRLVSHNLSLTTSQIAAATMGELCRKLGDKIIGDIIPMIKKASESQSAQTREGACMAISEVMSVFLIRVTYTTADVFLLAQRERQ